MPIDPVFLEVSWRVPNLFLWPVGLIILAWAFGAGFLAFTGGQASGQPDIAFPQRPVEPVGAEEPAAEEGDDTEA
jgi:hypothetical protein